MKWIHVLLLVCAVSACSKGPRVPLLPADAVILAFGDSLTAGTGAGESESYPAVLARLTGRRVINAGIPGEVSAAGAVRLPVVLEKERPALVVLCHGGNDLLARLDQSQLAGNLRTMIRTAHERGVPVILLAVPAPDLSLKPPKVYEEVAKEFRVPIERKALPHILAKSSLKSDHIHPNATGYAKLAEAVSLLLRSSGAVQ